MCHFFESIRAFGDSDCTISVALKVIRVVVLLQRA
jgi:hypothetical protein